MMLFRRASVIALISILLFAQGYVGNFAVSAAIAPEPVNVLAGKTESYSAPGSVVGSITDNDTSTYRNSYDGTHQSEAWYAVTMDAPALIDHIVYAHGHAYVDGGWFDTSAGQPKFQIQTELNGAWIDAGSLTDYPATSATDNGGLVDGQKFSLEITPVEVYGVRIVGAPVFFASAAELQAFDSSAIVDPNVLSQGLPSNSRGLPDNGSFIDNNAATFLSMNDGTFQSEDWYAVHLAVPEMINNVVFTQGPIDAGGGWFDASQGKPKVQIQTAEGGSWQEVGPLSLYPDTTAGNSSSLVEGQRFESVFDPVEVVGVRVIGAPAYQDGAGLSYSSIADLQAYYDPHANDANVLTRGTASYSRAGNSPGSFNDGDISTVRNTWNGQIEELDWYAVTIDIPQLINKVVYAHGVTSPDGGWFNTSDGGKPMLQYLAEPGGEWLYLTAIEDYPVTTGNDNGGLQNGQSFSVTIEPTVVYGVRIVGQPAQYPGATYSFSSIAELQAYYELPPREYVPLNAPLADEGNWLGASEQPSDGEFKVSVGESVYYSGSGYLSSAFHFKLEHTLPLAGTNWSEIAIRSQTGDSLSDAYLLVLKDQTWELQKRLQGATTVLAALPIDTIANLSSASNEILLASYDERDGVRLQLDVNGERYLSVQDTQAPIRSRGYFGAYAGDGELKLTGIAEGMPMNSVLGDASNWQGAGSFSYDGAHAVITDSFKVYAGQKFGDEFLDFTMRYSFTGPDWPGIVLRGTDASKSIFDGGSAYFIDMNASRWEVQKWVNGNRKMLIGEFPGQIPPFGTLENKQFLSDTEHTIRTAAIQISEGVRLVLYVDGQKVFDIVDEDEPLVDSGYFGIYAYSGPVTIGNVQWETSSPLNKDKAITLFDVPGKNKPVDIDQDQHRVSVEVMDGTDLSNIHASMHVSRGASVNPEPSSVHDYTSPVTFTVTAEDGSVQDWIITITTESDAQSSFVDIAEHPAKRDILQLYSAEIVNGVDDTHFNPDAPITRIDAIAAIAKAASLAPVDYSGVFSDVNSSVGNVDLVQAAYEAGLLFPTTGGKLLPQQSITKEEMVYLFAKAANLVAGEPYLLGDSGQFKDSNQISSWARAAVEAATGTGLLPQSQEEWFHPAATVMRAEFAVDLRRLLFENKPFAPLYNIYSAQILDAFPLAEEPVRDEDAWHVHQTNGTVPMNGTKWNAAAKEQLVYQSSIKHEEDDDQSWEMRIGKGGQIYSLETAIGELMPPQTANNVFMDEVIQPVSISYDNHNPDQEPTMYFIHGSGVYYKNDPLLSEPFYDPMMAYVWNDEDKSYSVAAWGQNAQIPSIWKSGLMYYTKVRDVGDGVIEVSYMLNNFGADTIDDISIPWGGVRKSVLPDHIIGKDGGYEKAGGLYPQIVETLDTDGWAAMTQDADDPDSFTLATVFGQDQHFGQIDQQWGSNNYTWGDANRDDFYVQAVQGRFHLQPGEQLTWKYYYVLGKLGEVSEKAEELASRMDYGFTSYEAEESDRLAYYVQTDEAGEKKLSTKKEGASELAFETFAQPMEGSKPLFLLRNTETKKLTLTMDPFLLSTKVPFANPYPEEDPKHDLYVDAFQYKAYDGKTEYLGILGYVYPRAANEAGEQPLITLEEALQGSAVYELLTDEDREAGVLKSINESAESGDLGSDSNSGSDSNGSTSGAESPASSTKHVKWNAASLLSDLGGLPEGGGVITREVEESGDDLSMEWPALFVNEAINSGKPVTLSMKTPVAQYDLPLQGLQLAQLAAALQADTDNIRLIIRIGKADNAEAKAFHEAISGNGATAWMEPLSFRVIAAAGDNKIEIHDFGGAYITRSWMIAGEQTIDHLTALWLTEAGEARFAPAVFQQNGDQVKVTVKRPGNSAYTVVAFQKSFEDIAEHWSREYVERLASKWLVKGYEEGRFEPDRAITRAEWSTWLVRALGLENVAAQHPIFPDVKSGAWYAEDIAAAAQVGLANGFEDGLFLPNQSMTRQEMAVMVERALRYTGTAEPEPAAIDKLLFTDQSAIAAWAEPAVMALAERKLFEGLPNGSFAPEKTATRGEAVTLLDRLLQTIDFIN